MSTSRATALRVGGLLGSAVARTSVMMRSALRFEKNPIRARPRPPRQHRVAAQEYAIPPAPGSRPAPRRHIGGIESAPAFSPARAPMSADPPVAELSAVLSSYVEPNLRQTLGGGGGDRRRRATGRGAAGRAGAGLPHGGLRGRAGGRAGRAPRGGRARRCRSPSSCTPAHHRPCRAARAGAAAGHPERRGGRLGQGRRRQVDGGRQPGARLGRPGRPRRRAGRRHLRAQPADHARA